MGVSTGSRIGAYEITGAIGAGGMGEVYRARDTKLGRDVAVKVLPAAFAEDHERVSRFRREAQVLASLNHPNIAAIYGIEEAEGAVALILELVEGDDLSARIKKGPIAVDEGLAIGRQIAEAFEEAHERGIVHRDLKPANIKVTPDGRVKVLDFGLAKAFTAEASTNSASPDVSHSPTLTHQGTEAGMILGTAAYMSPEQARGKPVDKRSDIWSFGVVLFEMFSGQRLFTGETVTDVLAALLTREPDWGLLPAAVPAPVRALIARCLERDPKRRLRDIGEARVAFDPAASSASTVGLFQAPPSSGASAATLRAPFRRSLPGLLIATSVLIATVAVARLVTRDQTRPARRPVIVYDIVPEAGASLVLSNHPALDIARDGGRIVYTALKEGAQRLYLRDRDSATARPIPGTEGGYSPAFSPDGRSVAFFADNRLKVASIDGAPATLATVNDPRGVAWLDDATLLLSPETGTPLSTLSIRGGALTPFSTLKSDRGERSHRWPQGLPDGGALFTVGAVSGQGSYDGAVIDSMLTAGGTRQTAVRGARMARYVDGRLLFARGASLFMAPFDLRKAATSGAPGALAYDLAGDTSTGAAHFAVSDEGTLAYVTGGVDETQRTVIWVDRGGATTPVRIPPNAYGELTLSPDGSRFAVVVHASEGPGDIWVYDLVRETFTRITFEGGVVSPMWSPDGRWIYYTAVGPDSAGARFFRKAVSGDRDPEALDSDGSLFSINEIARDGKSAYIHLRRPDTSVDIDRLDLGTGRQQPFVNTKALELGAQTSPDGRFVAYQSDETGRPEVFVRALNGSGRFQVSTSGGEEPRWAANGREIFYREGERLLSAAVDAGLAFRVGTPRVLVDGLYFARADTGMSYSVAGSGERFLMIGPTGGTPAPKRIRVIVNYPAALASVRSR